MGGPLATEAVLRILQGNGTSVVLKELSLDNPYIPSHQQICPTALLVALCVLVPLGSWAADMSIKDSCLQKLGTRRDHESVESSLE